MFQNEGSCREIRFTASIMMSDTNIHIAFWDDPVTRVLADMLDESEFEGVKGISIHAPEAALAKLREGIADVALLPSYTVLKEIRSLDILPAVALSSSTNPYATVAIKNIEKREAVIISVEHGQELSGLVTEIILKEQYDLLSKRVIAGESTIEKTIVTIQDSDTLADRGFHLDIAREWYELANYPLVWAVFVTRRGEATSNIIRIVRDVVLQIDVKRGSWVAHEELTEQQRLFYEVDLRYRLDDVAAASLSELCEYLYYYGDTEEIPTFSLASITIQDEE